jgi:membrane-bound metal-dependent hydrolase YbcI (DUF457 family)
MAILIAPVLLRALPPEVSPIRKAVLVGGVVFGTVAADLDIALGYATGANGFVSHGGYTHSVLLAVVFATVFALWVRVLARVHIGRAWVVGALAYSSHLLLDAVNHGRGIMLLWPLSEERWGAPIRIFYGVRHSDPGDWTHHLTTLATELILVAVVLVVARPLYIRPEPAGGAP